MAWDAAEAKGDHGMSVFGLLHQLRGLGECTAVVKSLARKGFPKLLLTAFKCIHDVDAGNEVGLPKLCFRTFASTAGGSAQDVKIFTRKGLWKLLTAFDCIHNVDAGGELFACGTLASTAGAGRVHIGGEEFIGDGVAAAVAYRFKSVRDVDVDGEC